MTTRLRVSPALLLLLAALASALCAAAPKVDIRVVARPRAVVDDGPVPIRDPVWMAKGPFAADLWSLSCVKDVSASLHNDKYLVDVCALRNVTAVKQVEEATADDSDAPAAPPPAPEKRRLLGIFRGWKVDPITLQYKYLVFDDGDECSGGERFSFSLELASSKSELTKPRVVGLKQVDTCKFTGKLVAHVPEQDQVATEGIHTQGVVDISDAAESLPGICGRMKCNYGEISAQVRHVNLQLRKLQKLIGETTGEGSSLLANFTMESSVSTLELSSSVLEKALGLLSSLEELHAKAAENAGSSHEASEAEEEGQEQEAVDIESNEILREESDVAAES